MDGVAVDKNLNRNNLISVLKEISHLDYFIWFGTLLGFVRDNDIIENDDDIDLYIDSKHREEVIQIIERVFNYKIDKSVWPNHTPYFIQANPIIDGVKTFIDFYFYDKLSGFILERWYFHGFPHDSNFHLKIPNDLIFPIKTKHIKISDELTIECKFPSKEIESIGFLYGERWMSPARKRIDYDVSLIDNKPSYTYSIEKYSKSKIKDEITNALKNMCGLFNQKQYEYFVFYTTYLNLFRNNTICEFEDTLYFYVNYKQKHEILNQIIGYFNYHKMTYGEETESILENKKYFTKLCHNINENKFFTNINYYDIMDDVVIDKHNFRGQIDDESTHLKYDKSDIFSCSMILFDDVPISIPNNHEKLLRMFYYDSFKKPINKIDKINI